MPPTFLVIGAMKAGTTSLHRYLGAHPDIFMSETKELDFFVESKNWPLGWEWYCGQFEPGRQMTARGEASTNYTKYPSFPGVPERIANFLPEVRLVYVLRDPVERIVSHVLHMWGARGVVGALERDVLDGHVVACSRYALQLESYLEWFSPDQILVVFSGDLRHDRIRTLQRTGAFIGVADAWPDEVGVEHGKTSSDKALLTLGLANLPSATELPLQVRRQLADVLLPDVERLRELLAGPLYCRDGLGHLDRWTARLRATDWRHGAHARPLHWPSG